MTEHHDDKTVEKVRRALFTVFGGNLRQQRFTDAIAEMQNAGILFRERSDDTAELARFTMRDLLLELRTRAELNAGKPGSGWLADRVDDMFASYRKGELDALREWDEQ